MSAKRLSWTGPSRDGQRSDLHGSKCRNPAQPALLAGLVDTDAGDYTAVADQDHVGESKRGFQFLGDVFKRGRIGGIDSGTTRILTRNFDSILKTPGPGCPRRKDSEGNRAHAGQSSLNSYFGADTHRPTAIGVRSATLGDVQSASTALTSGLRSLATAVSCASLRTCSMRTFFPVSDDCTAASTMARLSTFACTSPDGT